MQPHRTDVRIREAMGCHRKLQWDVTAKCSLETLHTGTSSPQLRSIPLLTTLSYNSTGRKKTIYDRFSHRQPLQHPYSHVVRIRVPGSWHAFVTLYTILKSWDHHFNLPSRLAASNVNGGSHDSLNDSMVHLATAGLCLTTVAKKVI